MEPIQPEVLIRQVESLAADLPDHAGPVSAQVERPADRAGMARPGRCT